MSPHAQVFSISPDEQLVATLRLLVQRFGPHRSLAEAYAASYALKGLREGRNPSIASIANATGCSKRNLSRWLA